MAKEESGYTAFKKGALVVIFTLKISHYHTTARFPNFTDHKALHAAFGIAGVHEKLTCWLSLMA